MNSIKEHFLKFKPNETIGNVIDLTCGCDQFVYLIYMKNGSKFIVKQPKTEPIKISNEVFALTVLKGKEIPIPQLLYSDDTILIESYLEGHHMNDPMSNDCNDGEILNTLYEDLGRFVRAIHSVTLQGYGTITSKGEGSLETEKDYLLFCMNPHDPSFKSNKFMKDLDIPSIINKNISLLDSHSSVLVHGDLHSPNILVHKGKISGIIDFADAIAGVPEYDLAFYYINVTDMNTWDNFIKGYGTNFNKKKMYYYVFILGTWLLSYDVITNEETKSLLFKESLSYLQ